MRTLIYTILFTLSIMLITSCGGYEKEWLEDSPELMNIDTAPDGLLPSEKNGWTRRPELEIKRPNNIQTQQKEAMMEVR